jgi:hypothetical protein
MSHIIALLATYQHNLLSQCLQDSLQDMLLCCLTSWMTHFLSLSSHCLGSGESTRPRSATSIGSSRSSFLASAVPERQQTNKHAQLKGVAQQQQQQQHVKQLLAATPRMHVIPC